MAVKGSKVSDPPSSLLRDESPDSSPTRAQASLLLRDKAPDPSPSRAQDDPVSALGRHHSGDSYREDPMEPLKFPDAIPSRGENHHLGRYVVTFDEEGKFVGVTWVRCSRNLMYKIPINCSQESSHWFQVFNQCNGAVIESLPTPEMR
jgi:hypothetical protein